MFFSKILGGVLNVSLTLRGVHVLLRIFRGGRVLRSSAANLRDPPPPLGVLTPSLNNIYTILDTAIHYQPMKIR